MGYAVYSDCVGKADPEYCPEYGYDECNHRVNSTFYNSTNGDYPRVDKLCPAMCLRCPIPIDLMVLFGFVFASVLVIIAMLWRKKKLEFHRATLDHLSQPWFQHGEHHVKTIQQKVLPWTRLFTFIYTFSIMVSGLAQGYLAHWDLKYFTLWNYTTLIAVFFSLTLHSWFGKYLPSWLTKITWSLYQVEFCNAIGLDIVFWLLLYAPVGGPVEWQMVNVHFINSVFLFVEFSLNSIEMRLSHVAYVLLYSSFYVIATWILYDDYNYIMPYPFMNVGSKAAPVWYAGLIVAFPSIYVGLWLLHKRKYRIIQRRRDAANASGANINGGDEEDALLDKQTSA
eukprot:m.26321 g.26321  ORF g.26321 m.26321 type:complete len:339 (-) comp15355_c0_seq1:294-1310(-)